MWAAISFWMPICQFCVLRSNVKKEIKSATKALRLEDFTLIIKEMQLLFWIYLDLQKVETFCNWQKVCTANQRFCQLQEALDSCYQSGLKR